VKSLKKGKDIVLGRYLLLWSIESYIILTFTSNKNKLEENKQYLFAIVASSKRIFCG